jgi:tetratricopeptide (TPR) repeat protein
VRLNAATGQQRLEAHSHAVLGDSLLEAGRLAEARMAFERSLELRPQYGDRRGEGWMRERMGRVLLSEGRTADARASLDAAKEIAAEIEDAGLTAALDRTLAFWRSGASSSHVPALEPTLNSVPETPQVT